ncbi:conserved hypothetical protein [Aspergillus terreus NIH2624]|uniref:Uncharacterized protein n=1 Tax=Aspergillus terreus (strain NIH 2624 / FGSC A1156) TaxID=341663 RepID=Q0CK15_ASPTN|nr:uncharacterized protein ATEG_05969 [Aspergillus terreus NIH2624]EAU33730.1 conserved hypothetical protein [Aspergillus terreus NIH2624]
MHIALLDVDVPVPTVYRARGLYSSQFRHLLEHAAARLNRSASRGISLFCSSYDVVGGALPPLASLRTAPDPSDPDVNPGNPLARPIDAILITGAAAAATTSTPTLDRPAAVLHPDRLHGLPARQAVRLVLRAPDHRAGTALARLCGA